MVDTPVLGTGLFGGGGSSPLSPTKIELILNRTFAPRAWQVNRFAIGNRFELGTIETLRQNREVLSDEQD
jgi:hypothetical protein